MHIKLVHLLIIGVLNLPRQSQMAPVSSLAAPMTDGSRPAKTRSGGGDKTCRCVPNQWEGKLNSLEREFSLLEGQAMEREWSMTVHYDYKNRLFASTDLESGTKSIADYRKGMKYMISVDGECRTTATKEPMPRMCLPENAQMMDEYRMGLDLPVTVWVVVSEDDNSTLRTQVSKTHCMPVSEENYLATSEFASLTSSFYVNVTLGIRNSKVFIPPKGCRKRSMERQSPAIDDRDRRYLKELLAD